MRQASFATVVAIRMPALMNLKCIPLLAMALLLPTASPAAAETIDIAIGHQSMCTDTYTGGIVIKELKLLEKAPAAHRQVRRRHLQYLLGGLRIRRTNHQSDARRQAQLRHHGRLSAGREWLEVPGDQEPAHDLRLGHRL